MSLTVRNHPYVGLGIAGELGAPATSPPSEAGPPTFYQSGNLELEEGEARVVEVYRGGSAVAAASVGWRIAVADPLDFAGGVLPSGRVSLAPGERTRTFSFQTAARAGAQGYRSFAVQLFDPDGGAAVDPGSISRQGVIRDAGASPSPGASYALAPDYSLAWAQHSDSAAAVVQRPGGVLLDSAAGGNEAVGGLAIWARVRRGPGWRITFDATRESVGDDPQGSGDLRYLILAFGCEGDGSAGHPADLAAWPAGSKPHTHVYRQYMRGARLSLFRRSSSVADYEPQPAVFKADGTVTVVAAASAATFGGAQGTAYSFEVTLQGDLLTVKQTPAGGSPVTATFQSSLFTQWASPTLGNLGFIQSPGLDVAISNFVVTDLAPPGGGSPPEDPYAFDDQNWVVHKDGTGSATWLAGSSEGEVEPVLNPARVQRTRTVGVDGTYEALRSTRQDGDLILLPPGSYNLGADWSGGTAGKGIFLCSKAVHDALKAGTAIPAPDVTPSGNTTLSSAHSRFWGVNWGSSWVDLNADGIWVERGRFRSARTGSDGQLNINVGADDCVVGHGDFGGGVNNCSGIAVLNNSSGGAGFRARIHDCLFDDFPGSGNGRQALYLGTARLGTDTDMAGRVDRCRISRHDGEGEGECLGIKSSGWTVSRVTLDQTGSPGGKELNVRHGERNVFDECVTKNANIQLVDYDSKAINCKTTGGDLNVVASNMSAAEWGDGSVDVSNGSKMPSSERARVHNHRGKVVVGYEQFTATDPVKDTRIYGPAANYTVQLVSGNQTGTQSGLATELPVVDPAEVLASQVGPQAPWQGGPGKREAGSAGGSGGGLELKAGSTYAEGNNVMAWARRVLPDNYRLTFYATVLDNLTPNDAKGIWLTVQVKYRGGRSGSPADPADWTAASPGFGDVNDAHYALYGDGSRFTILNHTQSGTGAQECRGRPFTGGAVGSVYATSPATPSFPFNRNTKYLVVFEVNGNAVTAKITPAAGGTTTTVTATDSQIGTLGKGGYLGVRANNGRWVRLEAVPGTPIVEAI